MAPLNESAPDVAIETEQEIELTPEQKKEKLTALCAEGRRDLRAGDYSAAADKLGEAAQIVVEVHGEFAAECYEPHFLYGRALMEIASVEELVLKEQMDTIPEKLKEAMIALANSDETADDSMTEEQKDEVRGLVAGALAEGVAAEEAAKEKKEGDEKVEETPEEKGEEKTEGSEEAKNDDKTENDVGAAGDKEEKEDGDGDASMEEGGEEEAEDEEEEEEASNGQLAWEALEYARKVCEKMLESGEGVDVKEWNKKKADTMMQLASCSIQEEQYDTALGDLVAAREVLLSIGDSTDRLLAEIYFHEARVYKLQYDFTKATTCYEAARQTIEKKLEEVKAAAGDSPSDEQTAELKEMEAIRQEIDERIVDCKDSEKSKQEVDAAKKDEASSNTILCTSNANTDSTANDISSLVRKKRVADAGEAEPEAKRQKSESPEDVKENEETAPVV